MSDYPELRKLQDIIDNQADRILDMEADLKTCADRLEENTATMDTARDRIEALEAALRVAKAYVCDIHALRVINAALAPEQDK